MKIPSKFIKSKKSFVDRLSRIGTTGTFSTFCAFPDGVKFNGQDKGENIILIVRKHPAAYIIQYLSIAGLLILPLLFWSLFSQLEGIGFGLVFGSGLIFFMIAVTFAVDTYLKWYFSINIITDERIVDLDFANILYHKFSEAQLEKIEDVSHAPAGLLSSIFDYGDVYIQTAATKPEFDFNSVPKPRDVQDTLLDLLEMKQKGQI